jgi:flagellar motility protein MotE (MotC chaperone)
VVKKLLNLVAAVLALNFLAAAGGVGYLVATGKLDKDKVVAIRALLSDPEPAAATQPATQPIAQEPPADTPMSRLDGLIAASMPRVPGQPVEVVAAGYDAHAALLERRLEEVEAQRLQLEQAKADFATAREKLLQQQKTLDQKQGEQAKLAGDSGFQKTLELYQSLPAKRTKAIFATLDDETVVRYLQSMEQRQAAGILKEFKTPEETIRAQAILEKMRRASAKAD